MTYFLVKKKGGKEQRCQGRLWFGLMVVLGTCGELENLANLVEEGGSVDVYGGSKQRMNC